VELIDIRCHEHHTPLLRPFVTSRRRTTEVASVVCEVQVEVDGIRAVGQGSAAETVAVTGEDATSIQEAINGPVRTALSAAGADGLTGFSARIGSALPGATSAKAAVDVALHDAVARATGVSLAELHGAPAGTVDSFTIEDDMTVSLEDPQVMATRAREAGDAGYRILKIKLGSDVEEDRRRLDAVLDAVPGARLRLDANQGWEVDQAIEILHRLERDGLPIDLVEQPVDRRDLTGMAQVRAAVGIPVMADESLWSPEDARRIVELGAADLLNIKLAKTGGLPAALAIADIAQEAGLACMIGAMMEPRISITAAAHLAAAHPAITLADLDSPQWFATSEPAGGYTEEDGWIRLSGGPGLGLEQLPAEG
jgi:L-alanine-DL-glutamate epimerase-like enolase superfamily enzyme